MATFVWLARFGADFDRLSPAQKAAFLTAIVQFVEDLQSGGPFRNGLRVKGTTGIFEMTWAPDGRATFEYGESVRPREPHVIWRRVGTHGIFRQP